MSADPRATAGILNPQLNATGRDGAIDHAARRQAIDSEIEPAQRFAQVLGEAVIATWGQLAQDDQERIFERAVVLGHRAERDEMLREQLAKFLHDHHERTAASD